MQCRLNVCAGVMASGARADIFNVPSCDVVKMVDGTGSKGYIDTDVMAWVWFSSCEALVTDLEPDWGGKWILQLETEHLWN